MMEALGHRRMVARCERGKPHRPRPERPRAIDPFGPDAFGTNPGTVSYLPSAGVEVATAAKAGRYTYEFPMTSAARPSRISMLLRPRL
jgi:hypothetical protein